MSESPSIGPWRVLVGDHMCIVDAERNMVARAIPEMSYDRVCANARLIAAAPELLAALIRIVDAMDARDGDEIVPGIDAARQAIAKATGGDA